MKFHFASRAQRISFWSPSMCNPVIAPNSAFHQNTWANIQNGKKPKKDFLLGGLKEHGRKSQM
jgi:hypothetical protein